MDCVFCKILRNEVSSRKIFEDETTFAFLDISPVSKGHILVIPKKHFVDVCDCDDVYLRDVISTCRKMGLLVKEKLGASGFNIVNASGKDAQQTVFHLHFHVVARYEGDGIDMWFHGSSEVFDLDKIHEALVRK